MELRDREESPPPPTTPPTVVEMVAVTDNYYDELNDLIYFFGEALHNSPVSPMASVSPASAVSPVAPVSPVCSEFPPSLPLPSPQSANSSTPVQLLTASPSAALIMNVLPSASSLIQPHGPPVSTSSLCAPCSTSALSGSSFPPAPPSSSVPLAQHLPSGFPVHPQTVVNAALQYHRCHWGISTHRLHLGVHL